MRWLLTVLVLCPILSRSQTTGGSSVFQFLRQTNSTQLTALGGTNVSAMSSDIGLAFNTPSLLSPAMDRQLGLSFQSFYGGIKTYQFLTALNAPDWETMFQFGVHYFNYGTTDQTDDAGNVLGPFRPADYVVQAGFSRKYLQRWTYGATLKFIQSNYGIYRASGIAADFSAGYLDTANRFQASLALRNAGTQLRRYEGTDADDLPFDIVAGISKRLKNAPLQFSITAHHLHQFDLRYIDSAIDTETAAMGNSDRIFSVDNIFRHIVIAAQLYVTDKVEITAAYNHLRRKELNVGKGGNGLNGFSMGIGILFRKLEFRYSRSNYQNNRALNQVGLNIVFTKKQQ